MSKGLTKRTRSQGILPLFMQPMAVLRFLFDPGAGWGAKLGLLFAVAYAVWPLDLIPDVVPIISWIDDAGIATAAMAWAATAVQRHASEREQRIEAAQKPEHG
ncbi:MAG: DUF1232 domain-containing protein [Myxococcota bacterium]